MTVVARLDTPHGLAVIVELADDDAVAAARAALPADERAVADAASAVRAREHVAGRTALRAAFAALDPAAAVAAVVPDDRGAPRLPAGWSGSISHKARHAAALVAAVGEPAMTVGVDLERASSPRGAIEQRVLTARERAALAGHSADDRGRAITLRFAIKEAIYKAIDPWVRRYVGFTEVEVEVRGADDPCTVTPVDPVRLPVVIEATWREVEGFWLATARARRR